MSTMKRWRGLGALVKDAVEHGSRAVERIQKETAARPFAILEMIPGIAAPALVVHVIHDATVSGVHGMVRLVNAAVGKTIDVALVAADRGDEGEKLSYDGPAMAKGIEKGKKNNQPKLSIKEKQKKKKEKAAAKATKG